MGTVERLDASLCLFARTFLDSAAATCALCCRDSAPSTPHHNAGSGRDACAAAANFSSEDEAAFKAAHAPDALVFEAASAVLDSRLAAARREDWGGAAATCACDLLV